MNKALGPSNQIRSWALQKHLSLDTRAKAGIFLLLCEARVARIGEKIGFANTGVIMGPASSCQAGRANFSVLLNIALLPVIVYLFVVTPALTARIVLGIVILLNLAYFANVCLSYAKKKKAEDKPPDA